MIQPSIQRHIFYSNTLAHYCCVSFSFFSAAPQRRQREPRLNDGRGYFFPDASSVAVRMHVLPHLYRSNCMAAWYNTADLTAYSDQIAFPILLQWMPTCSYPLFAWYRLDCTLPCVVPYADPCSDYHLVDYTD